MSTDKDALRSAAIRYLSRREYAKQELIMHLRRRFGQLADIEEVVQKLADDDWQSDARFAEMCCRTRLNQGYGPVRIRQILSQHDIDEELVSAALNENDACSEVWLSRCWQKKFSRQVAKEPLDRRKQLQFLLYRGFSSESANRFLREVETDDRWRDEELV